MLSKMYKYQNHAQFIKGAYISTKLWPYFLSGADTSHIHMAGMWHKRVLLILWPSELLQMLVNCLYDVELSFTVFDPPCYHSLCPRPLPYPADVALLVLLACCMLSLSYTCWMHARCSEHNAATTQSLLWVVAYRIMGNFPFLHWLIQAYPYIGEVSTFCTVSIEYCYIHLCSTNIVLDNSNMIRNSR